MRATCGKLVSKLICLSSTAAISRASCLTCHHWPEVLGLAWANPKRVMVPCGFSLRKIDHLGDIHHPVMLQQRKTTWSPKKSRSWALPWLSLHIRGPSNWLLERHDQLPIGSMYGIYANIWGILMVNVTIYSIHGSYGLYIIWGCP